MDAIELWEDTLRRIFDLPACIIIITGRWKDGKTDLALLCYEELKRLGIVVKGASNIKTKGSDLEYIWTMPSVERFMFADSNMTDDLEAPMPASRLYIYDESLSNTPNRQAMARLNVAWFKTIPELSKGNVKLIVISQEIDLTESIFYNQTFLRGIIRKISKTHCEVTSNLLPSGNREFWDIPRTRIIFSPWRLATFSVSEPKTHFIGSSDKLPICCRVGFLVSEGKSFSEIGTILNPQKPIHRYQVQRYLRYHLKHSLESNRPHIEPPTPQST